MSSRSPHKLLCIQPLSHLLGLPTSTRSEVMAAAQEAVAARCQAGQLEGCRIFLAGHSTQSLTGSPLQCYATHCAEFRSLTCAVGVGPPGPDAEAIEAGGGDGERRHIL